MTTVDSPVCNIVRKKVLEDAVHTSSLKRDGCSLDKRGLPEPHILVNLDKVASISQKIRADFLLAADYAGGWIVPIEMKQGTPRISKAVGQLQSAAEVAERWVADCDVQNFRPILATGNMPTIAQREMKNRRNWVEFRGVRYPVERIRCGSGLVSIFRGAIHTS